MGTPLLTIEELKAAARAGTMSATCRAQVESVATKQTRDGKPYREIALVDAAGRMTLRAWSDNPAFGRAAKLAAGTFVEVEGDFSLGGFGLEGRRWDFNPLGDEAVEELLAGGEERRAKQAADYETIAAVVASMDDPILRGLGHLFLEQSGERFRRAAAARTYHHARRGGLVEHVAGMMRAADSICGVYPQLNRDLLLAGALFHDCGKLYENCPGERDFVMPFDERGELLGHIALGIEMVNALWRKLQESDEAAAWKESKGRADDVRMHLLHLIASHHGEPEFGAPVVPKTPEAMALHHLDNLDAKLEMFAGGYLSGDKLADRIVSRVRPLPGNLVRPLERAGE